MPETKFWAEDLLFAVEEKNRLYHATDIAVQMVVNELEKYFDENSNIGHIPIKLEKGGSVSTAEWIITVGDQKIHFDLDIIKQAKNTTDSEGFPVENKDVSLEEAVKSVIIRQFPF
ncbi:hypothetical protein [Siminovitchia terrae]|uniref:hypothetical protein n=1 Tax=Siminovitchia terrae TaxID=1914933 RepID=UPI0028AF6048|nr:hypothetical protein [Siminovitchia terrae]